MKLSSIADTNRIGKPKGCAPVLHEMLRQWMRKEGAGLKFSSYNERFVTLEKWYELDERGWSDGWESS